MAFWGVEVKPKKPFKLSFIEFEGPRLHLSQATLGNRKSDDRTIVKCSVENLPAVYLCSLLPGTVETCSLDLYFDQDVTFSVKGSTSVHLVGYFEGTFDGNESGEDVEDDFYSDEEELENGSEDSLDGFIVSDDEDDDDDDEDDEHDLDEEGWSSEDAPMRTRKSGVTIEELPPEEPSLPVSKKKIENQEKSIVPHSKFMHQEDSAEPHASIANGNGTLKRESDNLEKVSNDKHASSSEDEDGFHIKRKRKTDDGDKEQPMKKKSTSIKAEVLVTPTVKQDVETDIKGPSDKGSSEKKKKKKKKRKSKVSPEQAASPSPDVQANGSSEAPSKQGDSSANGSSEAASKQGDSSAKKVKGEATGTQSRDATSAKDVNRKGTVRKYANGLEIENTSMGKPEGKQATPGKKVGMIYTGKLKSNGKIFDSNVGRKPFYFFLGVGEVIKGWDIGVNGMRVGDKRRVIIPPKMAYGSKGVPGIPPNSWLEFNVELVDVK